MKDKILGIIREKEWETQMMQLTDFIKMPNVNKTK